MIQNPYNSLKIIYANTVTLKTVKCPIVIEAYSKSNLQTDFWMLNALEIFKDRILEITLKLCLLL